MKYKYAVDEEAEEMHTFYSTARSMVDVAGEAARLAKRRAGLEEDDCELTVALFRADDRLIGWYRARIVTHVSTDAWRLPW